MDDLIKRMGRQLHSWELDEPFDDWWTYQKDFRNARDRIETQAAEIARLREALGWYANKNRWHTNTLYMCGHSGPSDAEHDRGSRARQALGDSQ